MRHLLRGRALVSVLLVFFPLLAASTVRAQITTLDGAGTDVGDYPSVAVGADGLGLVSYYDSTNGDLKVAHCLDIPCTSGGLRTLDATGNVGQDSALAVGADGLGLIVYSDFTGGTVKIAHCDDPGCTAAHLQALGAGRAGGIARGADGLGLVASLVDGPGGHVVVTHCEDALCGSHTSTTYGTLPLITNEVPNIAIGPDGLGLVVYKQDDLTLAALHCQNTACTAATLSTPVVGSPPPFYDRLSWLHGLAFGADGRGYFSVVDEFSQPGFGGIIVHFVAHCQDPDCSGATDSTGIPVLDLDVGEAAGSDGLGLVAGGHPSLAVLHCNDASCTGTTTSPVLDTQVGRASLAIGQDALPLIAYRDAGGLDLKVLHCLTGDCNVPMPALSIDDNGVQETDQVANLVFTVALSAPASIPVTVDFATSDGSATSPGDYLPTAGTLTFAPGVTSRAISVPIEDDDIYEGDETFTVALTNPANAQLGDAQGVGTIFNGDLPPEISLSDASVVEGDTGTMGVTVMVSLSHPSAFPVTLDWRTDATGGTATPDVDFLVENASLLFDPGALSQPVKPSVYGDVLVEPDEFFFVRLTNASGATFLDTTGVVTISDDDAPSLSSDELVHGSARRGSLEAQPGPLADVDYYRLGQLPYTSWEVVVDAASAGVTPLSLERLAADNTTVLQSAVPAAGGTSLSLRWANDTAFPVLNQHLRVTAACGASCAANAGYGIRALETTGRMSRFNDSASQVTVVILANAGASSAQGTLRFWDGAGKLLFTQPVSLAPQAQYVLNTATVPELFGASGSITVTSDAPYGSIRGKAVAVEPATGFTFDTELVDRPR